MKALILNSGVGKRMGLLTSQRPKCMTEISNNETIISRQLKLLQHCGISDVIITTGLFNHILIDYCYSLKLDLQYTFVMNHLYEKTNYIYSIYLAKEYLDCDLVLLHGDLVFEISVLMGILNQNNSCMTINSAKPISPKDFKAIIKNGLIEKIGIELVNNAVMAQPLYKINKTEWKLWLNSIITFCKSGQVTCYAENAFNKVSDKCHIYPIDFANCLCEEVDTPDDLILIKNKLDM